MKNKKVHFIASVKDDSFSKINTIANTLKTMGCSIDNILSFTGVITGSTASDTSLEELKIEGIKNIEPDRKLKVMK